MRPGKELIVLAPVIFEQIFPACFCSKRSPTEVGCHRGTRTVREIE